MKRTTLTLLLLVTSLVFYGQQDHQWTWLKGDTILPQNAIYGTKGIANLNNKPSGRYYAAQWTDAAGNGWIFGGNGNGLGNVSGLGLLNDLWKYTIATGEWTWMSGDSLLGKAGNYGNRGVEVASNKPGAREGAATWRNAAGDLYLFGGYGVSGTGSSGYLNDLWKYSITTGLWTWLSGDIVASQAGVYGTKGTAHINNKPGGRQNGVSWIDNSGNLFLFGGYGFTNSTSVTHLNDLWRYNPTTGQWTWMTGVTSANGLATYGTKGTANANNTPGCRRWATGVKDNAGRLWLIGGFGYAESSSANGKKNDVWMYNPSTNQWTWMNGDKALNQIGVYNTRGTEVAGNKMGARQEAISWLDGSNNIWVFGGTGYSITGSNGYQYLNDLWRYNIANGRWTWMSGSNTANSSPTAVYGTKGVRVASNAPSGKTSGSPWFDGAGNLWMFGGLGFTATGSGYLNDTWRFTISNSQWTWMSGDNITNYAGTYGTKGVAAASNKPGSRMSGAQWTDNDGNLWMMGGSGIYSNNNGYLNDLWKYTPSTNDWTWMGGDQTATASVYGTKGTPHANNKPGGRNSPATWKDLAGNFWLYGGYGYGSTTASFGGLTDIWRYAPTTGQWTWINGDATVNVTATYGTRKTGTTSTRPGARQVSGNSTDAAGNLWLYGGTNTGGQRFGDLWKYDVVTNIWTWISGDNTTGTEPVYGTKGQAAAGNKPGARNAPVTWTDAAGNIYLFGGSNMYVPAGQWMPVQVVYNDLWKYSPADDMWTWIAGDNTTDATGNYGMRGVANAANQPGSRDNAVGFTDPSGNLWLYGGNGSAATGKGKLNDLWKYNPTTNQWTWAGGSDQIEQNGVYGVAGVPSPNNVPGARTTPFNWITSAGLIYIMGGDGWAAAGRDDLNDLWMVSTASTMLPVRFSSFTARREHATVLLNWSTAQEQHSAYYLVERSADGIRYETIGKVHAAGNSNQTTRYAFTDQQPRAGNNFYRLRQVDLNEAYTYSTVVRVTFQASGGLTIRENPVGSTLGLTIQLPAAQKLLIQVKSSTGIVLATRQFNGTKGINQVQIPVNHLTQGAYIVSVNLGAAGTNRTFLKL